MKRIKQVGVGALVLATVVVSSSATAHAATTKMPVHATAKSTSAKVVTDELQKDEICGDEAIDLEVHKGTIDSPELGKGHYKMLLCYYNGKREGSFVIGGNLDVRTADGEFEGDFWSPVRLRGDATKFDMVTSVDGDSGAFEGLSANLRTKGSFVADGTTSHDAFTLAGNFRPERVR